MKNMTAAEILDLGINEVTIMGHNGNTMTLQGITVSNHTPDFIIAESEYGIIYIAFDQELTVIS